MLLARGTIYHSLIDEIQSLTKALVSDIFQKEIIQDFEKEFAKYFRVKNCIAFQYARTALYYSLKAKGIKEGDTILMPPITIKGMLDVVCSLKLNPIWLDINHESMFFSYTQLKELIDEKKGDIKVVFLTYLFGIVPNDLIKIIQLCRENNIFIIEDISQSLNAEINDMKLGTLGDVGIYSSSSTKTLDTYGGGLLLTNDDEFFDKVSSLSDQLAKPERNFLLKKIIISLQRNILLSKPMTPLIILMDKFLGLKSKKTKVFQLPKTEDELPREWFYCYTSLQAKIGLKYLTHVDKNDEKRIKNVEILNQELLSPRFLRPKSEKCVFWQFVYVSNFAKEIKRIFSKYLIDSTTSRLLCIAKIYEDCCGVIVDVENSKKLLEDGLFIPSYPSVSKSDLIRMARIINKFKSDK